MLWHTYGKKKKKGLADSYLAFKYKVSNTLLKKGRKRIYLSY